MYIAKMTEMKNKTRMIKQAYSFELQNHAISNVDNALIDAENSLDEAMDFLRDAREMDNLQYKIATYGLVEEALEMAGVHYFQAVLFLEQSNCDFHIRSLFVAHCSHQIKCLRNLRVKDEI